ncbi:MAG: hypothetical protein K2X68_10155 [Novosphingobium sp.]|nr:hypothetical protein [Novosphingobium sp.]
MNGGEWIAWAGVVIPLAALAWSAVVYAIAQRRAVMNAEYERFFQIMDHLGQNGGSIASKMAAAYELRKFPQYKEVIINLCEKADLEGPAAKMLRDELAETARVLRLK